MREQTMIVDGYNVIGNWPELAKMKLEGHFDAARDRLLDILAEYRSHTQIELTVVFDAMYVPGIGKRYDQWDMTVVFTKQDETADAYIERLAEEWKSPLRDLTIVTSDQAEQWTVFSRGALRLSSREFLQDVLREQHEFEQSTDPFIQKEAKRNQPWNNDQLRSLKEKREQLSRGDDEQQS